MIMRLILKALAGGVLLPVIYFGMFTAASQLVSWTHGDNHPSLQILIMPLLWPLPVIKSVSPYFYSGNIFDDAPGRALQLMMVLDFAGYALLSYCLLQWREKRQRLA
jgi:hypothetical protein